MSTAIPVIFPHRIKISDHEIQTVSGWPFADAYVGRLLQFDIPQRVKNSNCEIWVYTNIAAQLVGFGILEICAEYAKYANANLHPYLPLLAVNPSMLGQGYGKSIVRHLIDAAHQAVLQNGSCSNVLFLDVYTGNAPAINLYRKEGFNRLHTEYDPIEKADYEIMAR